jgi:hypothetical protein
VRLHQRLLGAVLPAPAGSARGASARARWRRVFARPQAWRVLDALVALTMWGLAASLLAQVLGR